MKFSIGLSIDAISISEKTANRKAAVVHELEDAIKAFLQGRDYGSDLQDYFIIMQILNYPEGYEHFYKDFKPKYIDYKKMKNPLTGEYIELIKYFSYSVNLKGNLYKQFTESADELSKKILASEIFKSFSCLDKLPKKIKDFDAERFKADMEGFFNEYDLLN